MAMASARDGKTHESDTQEAMVMKSHGNDKGAATLMASDGS
jgi:hypothetical protein